jgi:hypothetical protein
MIPKASGKMPPAAPWMTRPTSISGRADASAETSVPTDRSKRTIISNRSLPYMSPRRPISGVATEALRRYAVKIQLTEFSEVCSACWMSGSAGATSDCSSAYEMPPSARTAKVRLGCSRSVSAVMRGKVAGRRQLPSR